MLIRLQAVHDCVFAAATQLRVGLLISPALARYTHWAKDQQCHAHLCNGALVVALLDGHLLPICFHALFFIQQHCHLPLQLQYQLAAGQSKCYVSYHTLQANRQQLTSSMHPRVSGTHRKCSTCAAG